MRMKINGPGWQRGVLAGDKARLLALVGTGDEKMDPDQVILMTQYKPTTDDLSLGELRELKDILARGSDPYAPRRDVATIADEIVKRSDPRWIEEQAQKLKARAEAQQATEQRLLAKGLELLGGRGTTWAERKDCVEEWWRGVETRQAAETWAAAFTGNRMTGRQIGSSSVMGGSFGIRNKAHRADRSWDRQIKLDRGKDGIAERMNPDNFDDPKTGASKKNEKGLHDLSATLLDGTGDSVSIVAQLKPYKDSIVLFMPVPTEADAQVFAAVMQLTSPDAKRRREISSRFTGIRLAQGSDMHTTLLDISAAKTDPPKVRYGVSGRAQRAKGEAEVMCDELDLRARRTNALQHSVILGAGAMQKVNEIVMVYRAHKSASFPLFAKWDDQAKRFAILDKKTWRPNGKYISDNGTLSA
ncbi:hypothetical protein [Kibdelosporangium phytohabitans]|uniref:Uncharacterized protein n=1 Tax=Kibdelosporangium phytohabitans TaxID=860235 RepID=A0A0N7F4D1_9PSEU|nr:hypothetical protein [Kibdelosporangium phytohabitans]ALG11095.1 hypothetical protein AOZ06_33195 [Kibdelosporangium phytohabitans]MBE1462338.1 hypothetical protein [Kibdelosporangium phytohabitans]